MDEVKERMIYVLKYFGFTRREFCSRCGLDPWAFNRLIYGESVDVLLLVQKVAASIPVINTRWLLIGEGTFLLKENAIEEAQPEWININIRFAGFVLPMRIDPKKEPTFRKIGYSIVDKVNAYKQMHPEYTNERIIKDLSLRIASQIVAINYQKENESSNITECISREGAIRVRSRIDHLRDKCPTQSIQELRAFLVFQLAIDLYKAHKNR